MESPSDSNNKEVAMDNEKQVYGEKPMHTDAERGDIDIGIINQANPLARELKGRHMQMIAIGMV